VKEVIFATKLLIYHVEHIILTKFHWNIFDHQSRLSEDFLTVRLITVQNSIEINPIFLYRIQHLLFVFALLLGNSSVCFVFFNLNGWKSRRGSYGLVLLLLEGELASLLDMDVVIDGLQLLNGLVLMILKLIGLLLLKTQVTLWLIWVKILMLDIWNAKV